MEFRKRPRTEKTPFLQTAGNFSGDRGRVKMQWYPLTERESHNVKGGEKHIECETFLECLYVEAKHGGSIRITDRHLLSGDGLTRCTVWVRRPFQAQYMSHHRHQRPPQMETGGWSDMGCLQIPVDGVALEIVDIDVAIHFGEITRGFLCPHRDGAQCGLHFVQPTRSNSEFVQAVPARSAAAGIHLFGRKRAWMIQAGLILQDKSRYMRSNRVSQIGRI